MVTHMNPKTAASQKTTPARAAHRANAVACKQANNIPQDPLPKEQPQPTKWLPPPACLSMEATNQQEAITGVDTQYNSRGHNGDSRNSYSRDSTRYNGGDHDNDHGSSNHSNHSGKCDGEYSDGYDENYGDGYSGEYNGKYGGGYDGGYDDGYDRGTMAGMMMDMMAGTMADMMVDTMGNMMVVPTVVVVSTAVPTVPVPMATTTMVLVVVTAVTTMPGFVAVAMITRNGAASVLVLLMSLSLMNMGLS